MIVIIIYLSGICLEKSWMEMLMWFLVFWRMVRKKAFPALFREYRWAFQWSVFPLTQTSICSITKPWFGLLYSDIVCQLQHSLMSSQVDQGKGTVTLKKAHITNTFPDIAQLVGGYIFVAATVLTADGKKAGWEPISTSPQNTKTRANSEASSLSRKKIFSIARWKSNFTVCVRYYPSPGTWSKGWTVCVCAHRWWNGRVWAEKHPDCHITVRYSLQENTKIF